MPRPTIDEELAAEIRRIHREAHNGESAGSLQEALDTVVQLALDRANVAETKDEESTGWYPGKYAEKVVNRVVGESSSRPQSTSVSERDGAPMDSHTLSPHQTAVFKTRLGDDRTITIPEAEVDALGLVSDDILQIYAYAVADT